MDQSGKCSDSPPSGRLFVTFLKQLFPKTHLVNSHVKLKMYYRGNII